MRQQIVSLVNRILGKTVSGKISPFADLYPWQRHDRSDWTSKRGPDGPDPDDPKLAEMTERYRRFDPRVTTPAVWFDTTVSPDDIRNFRGNTQYVWQRADINQNEIAFALSYFALKSGDAADILASLSEDGAFGALTVEIDGRPVSRDLLDSVGEIDFLRRHVGLGKKQMSLLDIGAGYGRLAHRIAEATGPMTEVFTTDAYAPSTFLSEFYLDYRKTGTQVVPLDGLEATLASNRIEIATNIHSFSECTVDAIQWWVDLIAKSNVTHMMVVPNGKGEEGRKCLTNAGEPMIPIFQQAGYVLKSSEPRYADPMVQRFGTDPCTFFLFSRC